MSKQTFSSFLILLAIVITPTSAGGRSDPLSQTMTAREGTGSKIAERFGRRKAAAKAQVAATRAVETLGPLANANVNQKGSGDSSPAITSTASSIHKPLTRADLQLLLQRKNKFEDGSKAKGKHRSKPVGPSKRQSHRADIKGLEEVLKRPDDGAAASAEGRTHSTVTGKNRKRGPGDPKKLADAANSLEQIHEIQEVEEEQVSTESDVVEEEEISPVEEEAEDFMWGGPQVMNEGQGADPESESLKQSEHLKKYYGPFPKSDDKIIMTRRPKLDGFVAAPYQSKRGYLTEPII